MSSSAQHTTTVIGVTCDGAAKHRHGVRTVAQYHDKYWTSWELTINSGAGYGERDILRVPDADPGDDRRMRVILTCPDPSCAVRQPVRWEKLHAMLDEARANGKPTIAIKDLTESES